MPCSGTIVRPPTPVIALQHSTVRGAYRSEGGTIPRFKVVPFDPSLEYEKLSVDYWGLSTAVLARHWPWIHR